MSVARFIADQRTIYRVPHAVTCAILGVSVSWFYKWVHREPTTGRRRRAELDASGAGLLRRLRKRTYGSPRIHADLLVEAGWRVEREHRRRLDAPTRPAGPQTEAAQGIDQAGQVSAEVPGPAEPRLHRRRQPNREVVRRHHRDPHRRGQAVSISYVESDGVSVGRDWFAG